MENTKNKLGILLISGGFDSAVSGYLMQKQGIEIIAIHFSYEPFTDNSPELKSKAASDHLNFKKFISINIGKEVESIAKNCKHKYYFVLSKRLMLKKAEEIAKKENADFIITGESLAQVGSQTLSNLNSITNATKIQILRPLLTYDKEEIIKIAREIGTYDICIGPEVCDCLGPKHPATRTNIQEILIEEQKLK
ncbi:7-cyano-7-deazaguanine synthase [Candidatus Woesearchaeota archaeon]|nr:7-cyano-7-deazaguanine synthase [Candidatus Woesearchaeota archaeon]